MRPTLYMEDAKPRSGSVTVQQVAGLHACACMPLELLKMHDECLR